MLSTSLTQLIFLTLAKTTPLLLAALGGLLSESAGVINFALEGMMLAGAFGAVWATFVSGSPWIGLMMGALAGMSIALMHALACLGLRANQIVSSIALNLLTAGLTGMLLHQVFEVYGTSPSVTQLPLLKGTRSGLSILVPFAFGLVFAIMVWFRWSVGGLHLQACGENPQAAAAAGLSVSRIRFLAVLFSGIPAGLGGAYLSIGELSQFVENMTQGRGYLAIAALILGRWRPGGILLSTLLFGFSEAFSEWLAVRRPQFPYQTFLILPYLVCLLVLTMRIGKRQPPSALGQLQ